MEIPAITDTTFQWESHHKLGNLSPRYPLTSGCMVDLGDVTLSRVFGKDTYDILCIFTTKHCVYMFHYLLKDLMLVWRNGNINRTVSMLVYCVLHASILCTGAQWYEQFLQVGRLDWASILLGLRLSSEHLGVFSLQRAFCSLSFSKISLMGPVLDLVD